MTRLLAFLLALSLSGPAHPDPVTDLLFAEGQLATLPAGQEIRYTHQRTGREVADFRPVTAGSIVLTRGEGGLALTITSDGRSQSLDRPSDGGNPVLMVFLESVTRSMAAQTGGSPFYIRNRIKDALRAGGELSEDSEAQQRTITLRPFLKDPNHDRMGGFAELTLRFILSDTVPGRFLSLQAETPAATGYSETITLVQEGDE